MPTANIEYIKLREGFVPETANIEYITQREGFTPEIPQSSRVPKCLENTKLGGRLQKYFKVWSFASLSRFE